MKTRLMGGDFVGFSGHSRTAAFVLLSKSDMSERRRFSIFIEKADGSGRGRGCVRKPVNGASGLEGGEAKRSGRSIATMASAAQTRGTQVAASEAELQKDANYN